MLIKKVEGAIQIGSRGIKGLLLKNGKISMIESVQFDDFYQGVELNAQKTFSRLGILKKMKGKKIKLSLPTEEFYFEITTFTSKEQRTKLEEFDLEIQNTLELGIHGYTPGEYQIDGKVLGERETNLGLGYDYDLLILAIKEAKINTYLNTLKFLGLDIVSVVPDFISDVFFFTKQDEIYEVLEGENKKNLWKKLNSKPVVGEKTLSDVSIPTVKQEVIVDISSSKTKVLFKNQNKIVGMQVLNFGGFNLTQIIMDEYFVEYKEAENIKNKSFEFGIKETEDGEIPSPEVIKIKASLDNFLESLKIEIKNFEEEIRNDFKAERVIFCGGGSLISSFSKYASNMLEINSTTMDYRKFKTLYKSQTEDLTTLLGLVVDEVK